MLDTKKPSDDLQPEPIVDPDLPVVDCHHHLWWTPTNRYLIDEFAADLADGHKIEATVYIECHAMYKPTGPQGLRPVGEAQFVAGIGAMSDSGLWGPTRMCAGFVGTADLMLGAAVDEVLHALAQASAGRLRGIRVNGSWDADATLNTGIRGYAPPDMMLDPRFREGFARLASHGLVYDAWQYFPQLPKLCSLADAFPDTTIALNHCGGLLGRGAYAVPDNFSRWKSLVAQVAQRPNVQVKIGGMSPPRTGFGLENRTTLPTARELADLWRPYVETCIELFGPQRCLYESNYPADRVAGSYRTIWNALKLTASGCTPAEKLAMFNGNARRIYRLD